MSRKNIILKTINSEQAVQLDIRIIMMPIYPTTTPFTKIFAGYYKDYGLRIESVLAEFNLQLGELIGSASKSSLLSALTASVGSVTDATLLYHQLDDTAYTIRYTQSGLTKTIILNGSYFSSEDAAVKNAVLANLGDTETFMGVWRKRKPITVTSTTSQTGYPVKIILHNIIGTDTITDIYLGNNVRSDWGDVRLRLSDGATSLPYAITGSTSSSITLSFLADLTTGSNNFYIYYKRIAIAAPYKIACLTDQHYDAITDEGSTRTQALVSIDNFVNRMSTYLPDLAVNNGDKTGAGTSVEATQLNWYQWVMDHFAPVSVYAKDTKDGVAPGNHDFQYLHFSNIVAKHTSETWLQAGTLYGYWESADFRFISLDANYAPGGQTHMDYLHQGFGYINTDQITWLTSALASSTKPVIIFCHQPLCEMDTAINTLTKEMYHVQNRVAVRSVLEASGKVICALHGHVHWFRTDIINNIPYICMEDIGTGGAAYRKLPAATNGKWALIEIDREAMSIRARQEFRFAGVDIVIYDYTIPYKTIFDADTANNPEKVFASGYAATFQKSSCVIDPSQLYINNLNYIWPSPANQYLGDPMLSGRTFKVEGLTNNPNYGRITWDFAPQTVKFRFVFSARQVTLSNKFFKLLNTSNTTPSVYIGFDISGNVFSYNGATLTTIQTYSINIWYEFDIRIDIVAGTFDVYINATIKATGHSVKNSNSTLKQLEIVTEVGDIFLDGIRIEKWTATVPMPTSVGIEENL